MKDGVRRVFVRRLDRAEATELPDTAGANGAVFSPDSRSLAVLLGSGLITRIALADQQRKVLTSGAEIGGSITWSQAGIIFTRGGGLWIIPPEGGAPRALTVLDAARHEVLHDSAVVLPGERLVLFSSQTTDPGDDRIESVSIDGGPRSVVVERARTPVWSPTGHLLFARDGAILAVAFDPSTGTPRGTATPIMPAGAIESIGSGQMGLTLSSTGTLLFIPAGFTDARVVSVGRDGSPRAVDLPSGRYRNPRISPDGRRLLVESGEHIEALDLARGTVARLSTVYSVFSTWSADGNTRPAPACRRAVLARRRRQPRHRRGARSEHARLPLVTGTRSGFLCRPPHQAGDLGGHLLDVDQRCFRAEATDRHTRL